MESTTVKLYSLNYNNVNTYLATSLFVIGNMLFPQLFHLIPQGGITWLPIYFFTLIGAYKYGWKVGPFAHHKLCTLRNANTIRIACHLIEIRIVGCCCRMDCTTFRTHFHPSSGRCSTHIPRYRNIRGMGLHRQLLYGHSGFPYRYSRDVPASIRWLFIHQIPDSQMITERQFDISLIK